MPQVIEQSLFLFHREPFSISYISFPCLYMNASFNPAKITQPPVEVSETRNHDPGGDYGRSTFHGRFRSDC